MEEKLERSRRNRDILLGNAQYWMNSETTGKIEISDNYYEVTSEQNWMGYISIVFLCALFLMTLVIAVGCLLLDILISEIGEFFFTHFQIDANGWICGKKG